MTNPHPNPDPDPNPHPHPNPHPNSNPHPHPHPHPNQEGQRLLLQRGLHPLQVGCDGAEERLEKVRITGLGAHG